MPPREAQAKAEMGSKEQVQAKAKLQPKRAQARAELKSKAQTEPEAKL